MWTTELRRSIVGRSPWTAADALVRLGDCAVDRDSGWLIQGDIHSRAFACIRGRKFPARRGSALLAVLWLSVALSAIALTVAGTVRGEIDRAATASDDTRAYFLAQSGIERAILYVEWGRTYGVGYYQPGMGPLQFHFPTGEVSVEVSSESSKLNIN